MHAAASRTCLTTTTGLKFALHQLQWAVDGAHAEAVELIEGNGGQVAQSLRESGVTHIVCSGAVYRCRARAC